MEKTCEYDVCTGCGVCTTVCPTSCISFHTGDLGHIYPRIDTQKCIDCNNCRRVCPALNDYDRRYPVAAYAGIIKNNEDYRSCTSGGAAQALSVNTLQKDGVVYGCASLPDARIEHVRADNLEDLNLLKGSKYVQSEAWLINKRLKQDVKTGKEVLYIGTPCQCAAIKSLFKQQPDNLTIVEIICHGIPSQEFLKKDLIQHGVNLSEVDRLWFRTSEGYQIVAAKKRGNEFIPIYKSDPLKKPGCKDLYLKTFFFGYSFRPSCYTCRFARPERVADITIGDFWGLGKAEPTNEIPEHKYGISVILPCTPKGRNKIKQISELIYLYKRPVSEAIKGNHQLQHPTPKRIDIKLFNLLRRCIRINLAFNISFFLKRSISLFLRMFK